MQEVLYALRRVHEAEVCDYERIGVDMKLITGLSAIWPGRRRHAGSDRDPGRASVGGGGRQIAWTRKNRAIACSEKDASGSAPQRTRAREEVRHPEVVKRRHHPGTVGEGTGNVRDEAYRRRHAIRRCLVLNVDEVGPDLADPSPDLLQRSDSPPTYPRYVRGAITAARSREDGDSNPEGLEMVREQLRVIRDAPNVGRVLTSDETDVDAAG